MQPNVTLPQFKQWAKDCAPAARAVLMARAYAQLERERVDAYTRPIFDRYRFHELPTIHDAPPVDDPAHLYCCADEIQVAAYFAECDAAHRAHGFKGPEGHCPALTAEHLLMVTECALMDLAKPLFGIEHVYGDDRVKYLELLIGACLRAEKEGR
jgi:hypothetical protein